MDRPQHLLCGWLIVSLLIPAGASRAQDALRSALSLDRATEANTNALVQQVPAGHHFGPVSFTLGTHAGAAYDDNVNETQDNPQADVFLSAGINVAASWPITGQSGLQFGSGIGYTRYLRNTGNSGLNVTPDSALTYAFSLDDVKFTLFDQFTYAREVASEAALANVAILPRLENVIGTRAEWHPSQWTLQAGYSHDDYISDADGQNLNRSSEYFFTRGGWLFAEGTEAGVEASDSLTSFEVETQNNGTGISVGVYGKWQLRQSLSLSLRGGPTFYTFQSGSATAGASQLVSYYLNFEASQQLADFLSHRISVDRSVQPGLNGGSAYIEQLVASYSATWKLTQRFDLSASLTYENGSQPLPILLPGGFGSESIEQYDRWGVQPQIAWRMTDNLSGSVTYSHWLRQSNLGGRAYLENSVSLNLSYTF
jgi:hypothetical protein